MTDEAILFLTGIGIGGGMIWVWKELTIKKLKEQKKTIIRIAGAEINRLNMKIDSFLAKENAGGC